MNVAANPIPAHPRFVKVRPSLINTYAPGRPRFLFASWQAGV